MTPPAPEGVGPTVHDTVHDAVHRAASHAVHRVCGRAGQRAGQRTSRRAGLASLLAVSMATLLVACTSPAPATPPAPITRVTLLPDSDGHVGAVLVQGKDGEAQRVDQAYASVVVADGAAAVRTGDARADATQVRAANAALFDAMPLPPYSTLLYFVAGGTELTPESRALLPELMQRIRERGPTEIAVIGHTDTTGSDAFNLRLSQERARVVDKLLHQALPELGPTSLRFFGARELLVPTGPNVDEPRNRRVEVHVL